MTWFTRILKTATKLLGKAETLQSCLPAAAESILLDSSMSCKTHTSHLHHCRHSLCLLKSKVICCLDQSHSRHMVCGHISPLCFAHQDQDAAAFTPNFSCNLLLYAKSGPLQAYGLLPFLSCSLQTKTSLTFSLCSLPPWLCSPWFLVLLKSSLPNSHPINLTSLLFLFHAFSSPWVF